MAEAQAAVVLRHEDSGPAHLDEVLPERAREAVGVALVAERAEMRDGRIFGEEAARIVTQHRLFVVEN